MTKPSTDHRDSTKLSPALPADHFLVEGLHCPSCIREIETALMDHPLVAHARLNLTTGRLLVAWAAGYPDRTANRNQAIAIVQNLGFKACLFEDDPTAATRDKESHRLLVAMAIAGFAMMNIMLLSISDWSGTDMGNYTRIFFHWLSALIALPAAAVAGMPFYRSAWGALRQGTINMDVPIALAVILALLMSLTQTVTGTEDTYYDAAVMLLFFLLIGRYLDRKMRNQARATAHSLMQYRPETAHVITPDGDTESLPVSLLEKDQILRLSPGDRIPADGIITAGLSSIDNSLVTGESLPVKATVGDPVFAGTMNMDGVLDMRVTGILGQSLLDEIVGLMETAEQGRAKYVRLADKAARIYAPMVHLLALFTFLGWFFFSTIGWQEALITAISVLIITCPCALGLAVPVVQIVAAGRLFKKGILVKAPDGLERLAEVDTFVMDKTGTLTLGQPELANGDQVPDAALTQAAQLAKISTHPLCRALIVACHERGVPAVATTSPIQEEPGMGLSATIDGQEIRLGNRDWCGVAPEIETAHAYSELWLKADGAAPVFFAFQDRLRSDARAVVDWFQAQGMAVVLLSGDRPDVVAGVAEKLGISDYHGAARPRDKIDRITALKAEGRKIAMVGDGLNDAPALGAAHVSLSPSTAADISRNAADFIFQGQKLEALVQAWQIAHMSRRLVLSNFALAALYNVIAVPFAAAGLLTPLIAAIAMSSSSILVTGNALRLNRIRLFAGGEGTAAKKGSSHE